MKKIITLSIFTLVAVFTTSGFAADPMTKSLQPLKGTDFDKSFLTEMIEHHQQGIEMSKLASSRAQSPQIKQFAEKTASMQQKDIQDMQRMLGSSGSATQTMDHAAMSSHTEAIAPKPRVDETKEAVTAARDSDASASRATDAHDASHDQMKQEPMSKLQAASGAEFDRLFVDEMVKHHKMANEMAQLVKSRSNREDIKDFARKSIEMQKQEIDELKGLKK